MAASAAHSSRRSDASTDELRKLETSMNNLKYFCGTRRLRTLWMAGILVAMCSFGTTQADDTSLDDSAKKVGNNFGELLKGMGQEVKKITDPDKTAEKKENKKETTHTESEPDKKQENPK
jgi:hypothetical protein